MKHKALHPKPWMMLDGGGTFVLDSNLSWKAVGYHSSLLLIFHYLAESGPSLENGFSQSHPQGCHSSWRAASRALPNTFCLHTAEDLCLHEHFPFPQQVTSEGRMWGYSIHHLLTETKAKKQ